jgi:hypothetical protein
VYAALEWVLIALLLINGLLAYAIAVTRGPLQHGNAGASVDSHITWAWQTHRDRTGRAIATSNGSCVWIRAQSRSPDARLVALPKPKSSPHTCVRTYACTLIIWNTPNGRDYIHPSTPELVRTQHTTQEVFYDYCTCVSNDWTVL